MNLAEDSDVNLKLVELCEGVVELCEDVDVACDGRAWPTKKRRSADGSGPWPPLHQELSVAQGSPKASKSASRQHKRRRPNAAMTALRNSTPLILAELALDDPPHSKRPRRSHDVRG